MAKKAGVAVYCSLAILLVAAGYFGIPRVQRAMESPKYRFNSSSSSSKSVSVVFRDDIAPGMRAFIKYDGAEQEMQLESFNDNYAHFLLPTEALDSNEFMVWAVDRDGNKSRPKKLYMLDHIVLERNPNK